MVRRRLRQLAYHFAQPDLEVADDAVRVSLLISVLLSGCAILVLWSGLYLYWGESITAALLGLHATLILLGLWVFSQKGLSYQQLRLTQRSLILGMPLLVTVSLGGFNASSGVMIWGLVAVVGGALFTENPRVIMRWALAYLATLVLAGALQPYLTPSGKISANIVALFWALNIGGISFMILGIIYYFDLRQNITLALLRDEQARSESLLLNILPREIAAILKTETRTVADHFENASVLFADVVGFTPLANELPAGEVVHLLNEVFSGLDGLLEKHDLEKIKTIGDCYMVAAGVPRSRPDHATAITHFALEMQAHLAGRQFAGRTLAVRIGINSGPVVAGVIGRKKFIYDLWGDAVNIASRMESHGEAGAIQITRATYDLIQAEFECVPKGTIRVKGKGEMEVWHVVRART